jgi:hypothetical protein
MSDDPRVVRSIAVTADDVVAALETNRRTSREAVLRVTPPFSARMRARLHLAGGEGRYAPGPQPVHIDPERLVGPDAPPYPEADETADTEINYSPEAHYERHVAAVATWRTAVKASIARSVEIETPDGPHRIEVKRLG